MSANGNEVITSIMDISDDNSFEYFNDTRHDEMRFIFIPDQDDESKNIRWNIKYPDFKNLKNIITNMSLNQFEELKTMLERVDD